MSQSLTGLTNSFVVLTCRIPLLSQIIPPCFHVRLSHIIYVCDVHLKPCAACQPRLLA